MKNVTKKYLKDSQMVSCDFIDLGIVGNEHRYISFSKVEEDLIYYNFGYEIVDSDDVTFITLTYGLKHIQDFILYVKESKKQIRGRMS
jgi:hypothetical protein